MRLGGIYRLHELWSDKALENAVTCLVRRRLNSSLARVLLPAFFGPFTRYFPPRKERS